MSQIVLRLRDRASHEWSLRGLVFVSVAAGGILAATFPGGHANAVWFITATAVLVGWSTAASP